MAKPSPDEMIKNLIRDYPVDALEFIKPELIRKYGRPVDVQFNIQEIRKHSHYDRNLKNDLAVSYTFSGGGRVVLVLIEHWSDKAKFDVHRFAHYLIDLSGRFPTTEILPVALFTDRAECWREPLMPGLRVCCLEKTYLQFEYDIIRMKDHEAERYRDTKNKFVAVLRAAMKYEIQKKIALAVELISSYGVIERDIRYIEKNIDIIEFFLEISQEDRNIIVESFENRREPDMIVQELKRRGYQQGVQQGIEEGMIKGKRETARALLDRGMPVTEIAEITGLPVEEIEAMK